MSKEVTREWTDAEEQELAFSVAAAPINRFYVTITGGRLRVAVMERSPSGKKQHVRSAFSMAPDTAAALRDMLCRMIPIEKVETK